MSGYDADAMNIAIDYSKHIIKESIDQITEGKADAITSEPKLELCKYCMYSGFCGNVPSAPKSRPQIDVSSKSKYGSIVEKCENFAKPTASGRARKDPGYDDITKRIGADESMNKGDRRAILAMKEKLDEKDKKESGKGE